MLKQHLFTVKMIQKL